MRKGMRVLLAAIAADIAALARPPGRTNEGPCAGGREPLGCRVMNGKRPHGFPRRLRREEPGRPRKTAVESKSAAPAGQAFCGRGDAEECDCRGRKPAPRCAVQTAGRARLSAGAASLHRYTPFTAAERCRC